MIDEDRKPVRNPACSVLLLKACLSCCISHAYAGTAQRMKDSSTEDDKPVSSDLDCKYCFFSSFFLITGASNLECRKIGLERLVTSHKKPNP